MSSKNTLLPKTPLDSIARIVQREFQAKAEKELIDETNILAGKKIKSRTAQLPEDMEFLSVPIKTGFESRRSIRGLPKKEKPSGPPDDPKDFVVEEIESDGFSPVLSEGSIYEDFEDGTPGETPLTPEESALQLALAIRKGHEKGRPDIDWHLVRLLYVYGGWGYERISLECNIAFNLVRLYGRKGRWPEARELYRQEQAQKIAEKIAMEEDRLQDWQMMKRRQAGIDGLTWFTKAIANLRDDASPESIAKLGGLLDRMLSSVTGLTPVEQPMGGVNVKVENNNVSVNSSYPPNSPQARIAAEWGKKTGENDQEHTRRLSLVIRELYLECERSGLYADFQLSADNQRQVKLRNRLGLESVQDIIDSSGAIIT